MTQMGTVVGLEGRDAFVEVKRVSACGENCASCKGSCSPTNHRAKVENSLNARVGDVVKIETSDMALIRSALLVYFMPIVIMLVAYGVAFNITSNTAISVISCVLGLVISFVILKAFDQKIAPVPKIIRILTQEERTNTHGS